MFSIHFLENLLYDTYMTYIYLSPTQMFYSMLVQHLKDFLKLCMHYWFVSSGLIIKDVIIFLYKTFFLKVGVKTFDCFSIFHVTHTSITPVSLEISCHSILYSDIYTVIYQAMHGFCRGVYSIHRLQKWFTHKARMHLKLVPVQ